MRRRRRILLAAIVVPLLLAGTTVVVWKLADWPPPRLILKYGFPPTGGPTGRTKVIEGIEFCEISPGYHRAECRIYESSGSWLERLCRAVGLPSGKSSRVACWYTDRWVEFEDTYWISQRPIHRIVTPGHAVPGHIQELEDALGTLNRYHGGGFRFARTDEVRYAIWMGLPDESLGPGGIWCAELDPYLRQPVGRRWQGFSGSYNDVFDAMADNRRAKQQLTKGDPFSDIEILRVSGGEVEAVWLMRISYWDRYVVWLPEDDDDPK